MHVACALDDWPWYVVAAEMRICADRVQRGAVAVGANRQDAGRRLHAGFAHDVARVDAVGLKRPGKLVAERIRADGADARDRGSQLREADRGTCSRARRREPDFIKDYRPLALGDTRDRPAQDVEDVSAERYDVEAHPALAAAFCGLRLRAASRS